MGHNYSSARREEHVVLGRVDSAGEFAYGVQWPYNFTDRPVAINTDICFLVLQPCEACPLVFNVRRVRPIEMSSARVWEDDSVCWEMPWIGDVYHAS